MSSPSLKAYHGFVESIHGLKIFTPTELSTLQTLASKSLKDFIYSGGNELLAKHLGISTRSVSTRLKNLQTKGYIELESGAAWRKQNQIWRIRCLEEFSFGGSGLPPYESEWVKRTPEKDEAEYEDGRSQGLERTKSASSSKSKTLKSEKAEQYFYSLINLLPFYFKKVTYGNNLEEIIYEISKRYPNVDFVAKHINQANLGTCPENQLFFKFKAVIVELLSTPTHAPEASPDTLPRETTQSAPFDREAMLRTIKENNPSAIGDYLRAFKKKAEEPLSEPPF